MTKKQYAKLEKDKLIYAPNIVTYKGHQIVNPQPNILQELGYKKVVIKETKACPQGYTWSIQYTEEENQIVISYVEVKIEEEESNENIDADVVEKIISQYLEEHKSELKGDQDSHGKSANTHNIPRVFLTGNIDKMSKQTAKDLLLEYKDGDNSFNAIANVKWQGNSSLSYPKKNFTIKLYEDETKAKKKKVDVGFGKQSKYVLKANYIDHSHARNIVCARLWGDIVASRPNQEEIPTEILTSPNNGAVDGFPIKLYVNGVYQGIYTWNIPKDGMMGMDSDNPNHAILCAEGNNDGNMSVKYSTQFRRTTNFKEDTVGEWTIEFPDADKFSDNLKTSFNKLLTFVSTSSDEDFVANLSNYANVQSLIDYYIFAYLICGLDMLGKNMIMCTFDGVHWFASAYDLDSTFGLWWNGTKFVSATYKCPEDYQENNSLLWQRMEKLFTDEIRKRYSALRLGALSVTNVIYRFEEFTDLISQDLYNEDVSVYSGIPSASNNNIRQIRKYYGQRCTYVDEEMQTLGKVVLSSISATKTTQTYKVGDSLTTDDITVTAKYSDDTTKDVTSSAVIDVSQVDTSKDGTYQIAISYTEDDVTVTTTCSITIGDKDNSQGSQEPQPQEPIVDGDASFTPTTTCIHNVLFNQGDVVDSNVFKDYLATSGSHHTYVTTTPNSIPIYADTEKTSIVGYTIPVPATATKAKLQYLNTKMSTFIRFVDSDLQFIDEELNFMNAQNITCDLNELSTHPTWMIINNAGSSQTAANSMVLTFE